MIQQALVALIVAVAIAVSAWKLMPARRRLLALLKLDAWAAKHPALANFRERSLMPRITRAAGPGCAGCASNASRPQHPPR
jgi:hypothetical protein